MSNSDKFFNDFKDVIDHPKKYIMKHMEQTGQKAIGCMPLYTPEELVLAAGMFPVGVWEAIQNFQKLKHISQHLFVQYYKQHWKMH